MSDAFAVVFQMGKVASTSLTEALDALPGVTAVQSHFLGNDALTKVMQSAIEPRISDYFFHHQLGQLSQNITHTRTINRIRHGADPRNLVVLSLSRDPFTWFRSSLVQDITGYCGMLQALAPDDADPDDAVRLRLGLTRFLGMAADLMSEHPSLDHYVACLRARAPCSWPAIAAWPFQQRQLLMAAMRPSDWFDQHFAGGLGVPLEKLTQDGAIWRHEDGPARYGVIRYEDIDHAFPEFCQWAFDKTPALKIRNASRSKPMAEVIVEAFTSPEALRLRQTLMRSDYARRFSYA